ncbi:MAG: type II toxin-antitoxin system RelE/ParE family toxin [Gammaproteobacteria bacterium]|nr:type II toxin-antitoxin system RelE/ParE family toxin [Gammaproteobacteria bacterium]
MIVVQTRNFSKQKKLLHANQINLLDKAVKTILENPEIGIQKKADLKDVRVYKFKIFQQQYLLAYLLEETQIILLAIGSHRDLS